MRAPEPVALGCVSLVLCLLELPHGLARTRTRRDPPASLPWEHPGEEPPGILRHSPKLIPHHRPRHGARLAPRHRLLMPKLSPQHDARLAPRHRLLMPKVSPRHGARLAPRHRLLMPKLSPQHDARLAPRHRLLMPKVSPRHGARLAPRRGRHLILEHGARGRRHAGHLMRVGCVLGTCQVQNLSHRLWQLMGQSGRRDSSPMNPNSPHSYG